ncbi:MAG: MBL fold metallo-hydrolase [Rhodospirillales bacterium]|nr:MBL fold metallo-hydrolase [Rhodospirillales bacterium]MDH3791134.1 MBL fold metallo-hydrolase [Rhodospirillales bacterium]MDH3913235.1 MBL fold metallo-hydrolase [Rhodospirillales bacterium]MDH3969836.1 MBL fold metallo-hydrolase [Rhodospirillales bacterium]
MKLTLLGTGCPAVHTERYGPAQVVCHGGAAVLVDCGSGVTQRLLAAGLSGRDLDAVLFTHLHSDHIVDLFQLVISSWHQGRDRPQSVYGPPGTRRYVEGLMALWRPELEQRIAHERRPSTAALEVEVVEFGAGEVLALGGLRVAAVEVDHRPVEHAYGFVFEADGTRLVLSGDTRPCPALTRAAQGADMLVHEVFVHRELPVVGSLRSAETVANVAAYHTLSDQVGKVAAEAGVGVLVLTHFVPPGCDRGALLTEVAADFDGPVVLGEDLMTLDSTRRSLAHGGAMLGLGRRAFAETGGESKS